VLQTVAFAVDAVATETARSHCCVEPSGGVEQMHSLAELLTIVQGVPQTVTRVDAAEPAPAAKPLPLIVRS
jgi:hypothetical protein